MSRVASEAVVEAPRATRAPSIEQPLLTAPVGRTLLAQSAPILFGFLFSSTQVLVDAYFLSRLGTAPLASLGIAAPLVAIGSGMTQGIGMGVTMRVAIALGSGNKGMAARLSRHAMLLAVAIGFCFAMLGTFLAGPLVGLMGARAGIAAPASSYLSISLQGFVCMVALQFSTAISRASGESKSSGALLFMVSLLNLVLDPILIFGFGPIPELGIRGAAIATVVSYVIPVAISVLLVQRAGLLSRTEASSSPMSLLEGWRAIMEIGAPAMLSFLVRPAGMLCITAIMAAYGPHAIAALAVGGRIQGLYVVVLLSVGAAIGPFVSQNLSAGRRGRVAEVILFSRRFGVGLGLFTWALMGFGGRAIAGLFSKDPAVIDVMATFFWVVPASYACTAVIVFANTTLNALGRAFVALRIEVTRGLLLYVSLAWLGGVTAGMVGVFAGIALSSFLTLPYSLWKLRVGEFRESPVAAKSA